MAAPESTTQALDNAHAWLAEERRGDPALPEIAPAQIRAQLPHAVDRVMAEAGLHDPDLAALALGQSGGDMVEAVRLLAAFATGLPRFGAARPLDTGAMACTRRISALYRDVPGGQLLGPNPDHALRALAAPPAACASAPPAPPAPAPEPPVPETPALGPPASGPLPRLADRLAREGLAVPAPEVACAERAARLQALARAEEGYAVGLASALRDGMAQPEAFLAELRSGSAAVELDLPELGFAVRIAEIPVTECETLGRPPQAEAAPFARGYGLVLGRGERKAIAMATIDLALRHPGDAAPAEALLAQADAARAAGIVEEAKLPQYIAFEAALARARRGARVVGPGGDDPA